VKWPGSEDSFWNAEVHWACVLQEPSGFSAATLKPFQYAWVNGTVASSAAAVLNNFIVYESSVGLGFLRADICYTEQWTCSIGEENAVSDADK
jgi:hypothetical protein